MYSGGQEFLENKLILSRIPRLKSMGRIGSEENGIGSSRRSFEENYTYVFFVYFERLE